jgi:hypothetical protein
MVTRVLAVALAMTMPAFFVAACGDTYDAGSDGDGDGDASPTAVARAVVVAPIDELDLIIRESFPPQYAIRIVSGLPDGCTEFNEAKLSRRTGNTIDIEVTNTHPSDPSIACTAIYGMHESIVELGTDFTSGEEYIVKVNDRDLRFTAQ